MGPGGDSLFVTVFTYCPVGGQQWAFGAHGVAALVLVVEPGYAPRLDPAVVTGALGLTATESQIAVLLAAGQTVGGIAVATGRPTSAVYWHLKQSYQKLGIARRWRRAGPDYGDGDHAGHGVSARRARCVCPGRLSDAG